MEEHFEFTPFPSSRTGTDESARHLLIPARQPDLGRVMRLIFEPHSVVVEGRGAAGAAAGHLCDGLSEAAWQVSMCNRAQHAAPLRYFAPTAPPLGVFHLPLRAVQRSNAPTSLCLHLNLVVLSNAPPRGGAPPTARTCVAGAT